jgi:release factor glutamine methyltransferase
VAYLVGQKEFFSIAFAVTPDVLIPRPDTETLVVALLAAIKERPRPRVVDVGTGSGCIALACAKVHETAVVTAIDVSEPALVVARRNAQALGLAHRVEFRRGDLLEPVAADDAFDAIVSNPPYIATHVIADLDASVRDFEPMRALDGGPDGLDVVRRLIAGAAPKLKPGGVLLLEIGSDQEAPVRALIEGRPGLTLAPTIRDHAHRPRVLKAVKDAR